MPLHETKTCSRCNKNFECKPGDVANCECSKIILSIEEKAFIEDRYTDCLCLDCLMQLKNRFVFFKEKYFFNGA